MKKYILKSVLLFGIAITSLSCTNADDIEIPPFTHPYFFADFNDTNTGSNIEIPGTINTNLTNSILWTSRYNSSSDNKTPSNCMQFSSFYSGTNTSDNVWFILPEANLEVNQKLELSFKLAQAFPTGNFPLQVLYSLNFDGDQNNIENAVWTAIPFNFSETVYNKYADIKNLSYLNEGTEVQKVYFAFNYKGAKTGGATTTVSIDNVKLLIN